MILLTMGIGSGHVIIWKMAAENNKTTTGKHNTNKTHALHVPGLHISSTYQPIAIFSPTRKPQESILPGYSSHLAKRILQATQTKPKADFISFHSTKTKVQYMDKTSHSDNRIPFCVTPFCSARSKVTATETRVNLELASSQAILSNSTAKVTGSTQHKSPRALHLSTLTLTG